MNDYRYIGKSLSSDNVYSKVTGQMIYTSDMNSIGMLHIECCNSEFAHGILTSVDTSEAEKMPGVHKVYTAWNTPDTYFDRGRVSASEVDHSFNQERLFDRHIRYYGERVAAVVAESPQQARAACRKIRVTYDPLPAVISMDDAARADAPKLHESGNVYPAVDENYVSEYHHYADMQGERTFATEMHMGRITHLSIETQCARASYDRTTRKLTVWSGCQTVYGIRSTVADLLKMPYSKVRVIKSVMGGSFGCKQEMIVEPLTAYVAKDLQADVRLVFSREDQILNTMMKTNLDSWVESKFDSDGTIKGVSIRTRMDAGAYQTITPTYLRTMGGKLGKVYRMPAIRFEGQSICTNTPSTGSFRGWGSGEAAITLESHINYAARQLGIDPIELRMKNILNPHEMDSFHTAEVGNVRFRDALITGRDRFRWKERKQECQEKNREKGRYRYGVGMAMCSHTTSFSPYFELASSNVAIQDDGSVIVRSPIHDHGCGTTMAIKKIVAEVLELPLEIIEVQEADTENHPYDYGCIASRTLYVFGGSVKLCSEKVLEKGKKTAALMLGCLPDTVWYEEGEFFCEQEPEKHLTWKQIWEYSVFSLNEDLEENASTHVHANPGSAAVHLTQVRVDTYTGKVKVEECMSVHDVGKAINPDMCIGQIGSGIQQGIGIAISEEIKIDPNSGETLITNFKNYEVANAWEMPDYEAILLEEPEPTGPYGAKGVGEIVVCPIAPALLEAVNDALGTSLNQIPLTPAFVREACERYLLDDEQEFGKEII